MPPVTFIEYDAIPADAWRRLRVAADDRRHPLRIMIVATVDDDGRPNARVLILRGASRERRQLWFHTDARSEKVDELRREPGVCIVGYDPRDDVQMRLYGRARLHHDDEIAHRHWEQADMAVRSVYGSIHSPGEPLPAHDPRPHQHQESAAQRDPSAWRDNFLVVAVDVERIDWLQVNGAHQRRAVLRRDRDWTAEPVAP